MKCRTHHPRQYVINEKINFASKRVQAVNQDTTKQNNEQEKDLVTLTDKSLKTPMSMRTNLATPVEEKYQRLCHVEQIICDWA